MIVEYTIGHPMILAAQQGLRVNESAYRQLDPAMTRSPKNTRAAYLQSAYFIALAKRRADALNLHETEGYLLRQLEAVLREREAARQQDSWACAATGIGCGRANSASVLAKAIEAIESAGLPADDQIRIVTILRANRRGVLVQRATPYVVVLSLGVIGLAWWRSTAKNRDALVLR